MAGTEAAQISGCEFDIDGEETKDGSAETLLSEYGQKRMRQVHDLIAESQRVMLRKVSKVQQYMIFGLHNSPASTPRRSSPLRFRTLLTVTRKVISTIG